MKAKTDEEWVPRALREVWEWKDSIYQQTKHLSTREALREILRMAREEALKEGLVVTDKSAAKVAEKPAKYRAKRKS